MATTKPTTLSAPDAGYRLTDSRSIMEAVLNQNGATSTYAITAAGTTAATATQLASVLNQVDTTAASTGVALPLSTGRRSTPSQVCYIVNNGANILKVYGFPGSTDTINGVAGATGVSLAPGTSAIFRSVKPAAWFSTGAINTLPANQTGTFTANGATSVTVTNANITAASVVTFGLNTVGGTISAAPYMFTVTPGTGFTVRAGASDTSIYNYLITG